MKVAIVHDWLFSMRGGERCLEVLAEMFPEADIFTLFYEAEEISAAIRKHVIQSSLLQRLPKVRRYYRHLLPFYWIGVNDISKCLAQGNYRLVISISHCVAKNIVVPQGAQHVCYCLTPARYLWDQYDSYFKNKWYEPLVRRLAVRMRERDVLSAAGVDKFIAISDFVRKRIATCYQRDAAVVFPPVRTEWILPRHAEDEGEGFLCVNALVPYKNVRIIVEAFNRLGLPLKIVGRGPEAADLQSMAKANIEFIPNVSDEELAKLYQRSKALVFAAEEDFGMVPVEMQAAGRPIICWAKGGAMETVVADGPKRTGLMFSDCSADGISRAVDEFMVRQKEFSVDNCLRQAKKFSLEKFQQDFRQVISDCQLPDSDGVESAMVFDSKISLKSGQC